MALDPSPQQAMYAVGAVEVAAGLLVASRPRWGGLVVAAGLAGIIVNQVTLGEYYDVGLLAGALALSRLAEGRHERRGLRHG